MKIFLRVIGFLLLAISGALARELGVGIKALCIPLFAVFGTLLYIGME